jgi:transcriptional regulator with XRE-family HTH domain
MTNTELKKRRERLGLTQTELADLLGVASNTVSGYETGRLEVPKFMDLVLEALDKRHIESLKQPVTDSE